MRALTRTIRRRSGEAKAEVLELTKQTGQMLRSLGQGGTRAGRYRAAARARPWRQGEAEGRPCAGGPCGPLRESHRADQQAGQRARRSATGSCRCGTRTPGRSARASSGKPERVRVRRSALRDHAEHEEGCARVHPPADQPDREPGREHAAARYRQRTTQAQHHAEGGDGRRRVHHERRRTPRSRAWPTRSTSPAARKPGSRRTRRRRRRYRTGAEGRISHLKRGYGLNRSRLKGDSGHQIWDGWATLTYNAETYTTL